MTISSRSNPSVTRAAKLHQRKHRRDTGLTLAEGPHLVEAAFASGAEIELVFALEDDVETAALVGPELLLTVTQPVLERVAGTESPRGPIAVVKVDPNPARRSHAIVLWQIADPGNVGTLIRTAEAFQLDLLVGPGTADVWAPKVLRSGAGGHFTVGMEDVKSIAHLKSMDYRVIASVPSEGNSPSGVDIGLRSALVVGSEAHGLPPEVVGASDEVVALAMPGGTESLNAGVAGSILAYALYGAKVDGSGSES